MATQETLQQLQYPQWHTDRQQQMMNTIFGTEAGGGVLGQQLQIPGQQVAGFTPTQTGAMQMAQQGIGSYQPYLDAAQSAQTAALGTAGLERSLWRECSLLQRERLFSSTWIHTSNKLHKKR